jgi:filamentous hemagglutinin family protein
LGLLRSNPLRNHILKNIGSSLLFFLWTTSLFALPTEPTVVHGSATFTPINDGLEITCSNDSIIQWKSFGIEQKEKVTFFQPTNSSFVLNRITGTESSQLFGKLLANGGLFLLNPNGILFGEGARIEVGSLMASTLNLSDEDFLLRNFSFSGSEKKSIINFGEIVGDKDIFLLSSSIDNQGKITSLTGKVGLGAGVQILVKPSEKVSLYILSNFNEGTKETVGLNLSGNLRGSEIELRAGGNLYDLAINGKGRIDAQELREDGGEVYLSAEGGKIHLQEEQIVAQKENRGGKIELLAEEIAIEAKSLFDVCHPLDGGTIDIGKGSIAQQSSPQKARSLSIDKEVILDASSRELGSGGKIVVCSDETTLFEATAKCHGGANGGDGGSVEISGAKQLDFKGHGTTSAPNGKPGKFSLSSQDLSLQQENNVHLLLEENHVFLTASGGEESNIQISDNLFWSSNRTLTLLAENKILLNATIDNSSSPVSHDSLIAQAKEIEINAPIKVGNNQACLFVGTNGDGLFRLNQPIEGSTVLIKGGEKNDRFLIGCEPFLCHLQIDGGALSSKVSKTLSNCYASATWKMDGENSGQLGLIDFHHINTVETFAKDHLTITGQMDELKLKELSTLELNGGRVRTTLLLEGGSSLQCNSGMLESVCCEEGFNTFNMKGGEIKTLSCNKGGNSFYIDGGNIQNSSQSANTKHSFHFLNGSLLNGSIDGGEGICELNYEQYGSAIEVDLEKGKATGISGEIRHIHSIVGDTNFLGKLIFAATPSQCSVDNLFSGNVNQEVVFAKIAFLEAHGSENTFLINGTISQISGGENNVYNLYSQANVLDRIEGGSLSNLFNFFPGANIQGAICGNGPNNEINYQNYKEYVEVNLKNSSATGIRGGFSNIQRFVGDRTFFGTLIGNNISNLWTIDQINGGSINETVFFLNFDSLIGGEGSDCFYLNKGGTLSGIEGGSGENKYYFNGANIEEQISGKGVEETFIFLSENPISGNIIGNGSRVNVLDYSSYLGNTQIDLSTSHATGFLGTFSNINKVIGNGKTLLRGKHEDCQWRIDKPYGGTCQDVAPLDFFNIQEILAGDKSNQIYFQEGGVIDSFSGGLGQNVFYFQKGDVISQVLSKGTKDRFVFESGATLTGSVIGNNKDTTLDYSNYGAPICVDLENSTATGIGTNFSNIQEILGDRQNFGELIGKEEAGLWQIDGEKSGSCYGLRFSNFAQLTCGNSDNTFSFFPSGQIDRIKGVLEKNILLDYSHYQKSISLDIGKKKVDGLVAFDNVSKIQGGSDFENHILGSNAATTWTLNGVFSGEIRDEETILFSQFSHLVGGEGNNTFILLSEMKTIRGKGNNLYQLYPGAKVDFIYGGTQEDLFYLFDRVELDAFLDAGTGGKKELNYSHYKDSVEIHLPLESASGGLQIKNFNKFVGDEIQGGKLIGPNSLNLWKIDAKNSGSINETLFFSNFSDLKGINQENLFQFYPQGEITGSLSGDLSAPLILDYSHFSSPVVYDLSLDKVTKVGGTVSNLQKIIGCENVENKILGPSLSTHWEILSENSGKVSFGKELFFTNFHHLKGSDLPNIFSIHNNIVSLTGGLESNVFHLFSGTVETIRGGVSNVYNIYQGADIHGELQVGTKSNLFNFFQNSSITGRVDFGVGEKNILNYETFGSKIELDWVGGSVTAISSPLNLTNLSQIIGDKVSFGKINALPASVWILTGNRSGLLNSQFLFTNISELCGEGYQVFLPKE